MRTVVFKYQMQIRPFFIESDLLEVVAVRWYVFIKTTPLVQALR